MQALDNLVKIRQLHQEAPIQAEFDGMLAAARIKLKDAQISGLSKDGQFFLAYSAAHAIALAALRWHGYRSDNRFMCFQCLKHTVGLDDAEWRVFDLCHKRRNVAEYEGHLDVDAALLNDLLRLSNELLTKVSAFPTVNTEKGGL